MDKFYDIKWTCMWDKYPRFRNNRRIWIDLSNKIRKEYYDTLDKILANIYQHPAVSFFITFEDNEEAFNYFVDFQTTDRVAKLLGVSPYEIKNKPYETLNMYLCCPLGNEQNYLKNREKIYSLTTSDKRYPHKFLYVLNEPIEISHVEYCCMGGPEPHLSYDEYVEWEQTLPIPCGVLIAKANWEHTEFAALVFRLKMTNIQFYMLS